MAIDLEATKTMENETEVRYEFEDKDTNEKGLLSLDKKLGNISIIIPIKNENRTRSACYAVFKEFRDSSKKEYPKIATWKA